MQRDGGGRDVVEPRNLFLEGMKEHNEGVTWSQYVDRWRLKVIGVGEVVALREM
jgi:hypothetical protein